MADVLGIIDIQVVFIFVLVFLLCYFFLAKKGNLPPGPRGLPFIGNVIWFRNNKKSSTRLPNALLEMTKQYGDVIYMSLGRQNIVFLQGYDTIQEVMVKQADVVSYRPHWVLKNTNSLFIGEGQGVVWGNGHNWKVMRKLTLQTLRDFGVGKSSLEEKICVEIDAASDTFTEANGPTEVRHVTSKIIANVIYGIAFGKRFDHKDEELDTILENLDALFKPGGPLDPTGTLPDVLLKIFDKQQYKERQEIKETFNWVTSHIYNKIHEHEATFDPENIRDFVDLYLQTKAEETTDKAMYSVENMFSVILDMFVAGSETTSNTLNWCILFMMEYPDVQKRCQDEIQERYGDRRVSWADNGTLPYTEATMLEIQRMSNIAEFTVPHTSMVDITIRGYLIPKRSLIQANLYSANMDPRHWDQPEVFNPERFLKDGKFTKNKALIPFGIGPRMCLGESLAKMEIFLVFTNLLQRFTFKREDDNIKHSFERVKEQLTAAPLPYKTRAIQRL